jgi:hypothetical protein
MENYIWLGALGYKLAEEYTHRYGKRHKSQDVIEWCIHNLPRLPFNGERTEFPKAMPEECKVDDVVESYRRYYIMEKKDFCVWTKRETPDWFKINEENERSLH